MSYTSTSFTPDEIEYIHDRLGYYTIATIAESLNRRMGSVQNLVEKTGGQPLSARDSRGMSTKTAATLLGTASSTIIRWIYDGALPVMQVPKPYRITGKPKPDFYIIDTDKMEPWLYQGHCLRSMNPPRTSPYHELIHTRRAQLKREWIPTTAMRYLPVTMQTINEWTRDNNRHGIPSSVFRMHNAYYERTAMATWAGEYFGRKYRYLIQDTEW